MPARALATRAEMEERRRAQVTPFPLLVSNLFTQIEDGVSQMRSCNEGFVVTRNSSELILTTADSKNFVISIDVDTQTVTFTAVKSGQPYAYKHSNGLWISVKDGHFLLEHLARELVYHCKGFPTF